MVSHTHTHVCVCMCVCVFMCVCVSCGECVNGACIYYIRNMFKSAHVRWMFLIVSGFLRVCICCCAANARACVRVAMLDVGMLACVRKWAPTETSTAELETRSCRWAWAKWSFTVYSRRGCIAHAHVQISRYEALMVTVSFVILCACACLRPLANVLHPPKKEVVGVTSRLLRPN